MIWVAAILKQALPIRLSLPQNVRARNHALNLFSRLKEFILFLLVSIDSDRLG